MNTKISIFIKLDQRVSFFNPQASWQRTFLQQKPSFWLRPTTLMENEPNSSLTIRRSTLTLPSCSILERVLRSNGLNKSQSFEAVISKRWSSLQAFCCSISLLYDLNDIKCWLFNQVKLFNFHEIFFFCAQSWLRGIDFRDIERLQTS